MTKNLIIIALILLVIYYYRQQKQPATTDAMLQKQLTETIRVNKTFASFCKDEIGGKDIEEIRTKLNGRKLSEILEENEDYETEVDTLRRTKGELEADLLAQSNSFKSQIREKEGTIRRLEDKVSAQQKEKKDLQEFGKKELEKFKKEEQKEQSEIEKALDQVIKGINDLSKELDD